MIAKEKKKKLYDKVCGEGRASWLYFLIRRSRDILNKRSLFFNRLLEEDIVEVILFGILVFDLIEWKEYNNIHYNNIMVLCCKSTFSAKLGETSET